MKMPTAAKLVVLAFLLSFTCLGHAAEPECDFLKERDQFKEEESVCKQLAEQGDVDAQLSLVKIYMDRGRNWQKAEKWGRLAIKNGSLEAYAYVATILTQRSNPEEVREGMTLYLEAGKKGANVRPTLSDDFSSRFKLSDYPEMFDWIVKEAKAGDTDFQRTLGEAYKKGFGVPQDINESIKWYEKLASQGKWYAQYELGLIYEKGKYLPADKQKALKYYKMAATRGIKQASLKVNRLEDEINGKDKPIPKLMVGDRPESNSKQHYWVGRLYSDGTIDVVVAYENGKWTGKDFNLWLEENFPNDSLPSFDRSGSPMTYLKVVELDFEGEGLKSHSWFPNHWYSLSSGKQLEVDRLARILSECADNWSLLVKGKEPHDPVFGNSFDDESDPTVVDTVVSWDADLIDVEKIAPENAKEIVSLVESQLPSLEKSVFDPLWSRITSSGGQVEPMISGLSVWSAEERDKTRRADKVQIRKISIQDNSILYQYVSDYRFDSDSKPSIYTTAYSGWVHAEKEKLTVWKHEFSLMDLDWKSMKREYPISGGVALEGSYYVVGEHYDGEGNLVIYRIDNKGIKIVLRKPTGRSCC